MDEDDAPVPGEWGVDSLAPWDESGALDIVDAVLEGGDKAGDRIDAVLIVAVDGDDPLVAIF